MNLLADHQNAMREIENTAAKNRCKSPNLEIDDQILPARKPFTTLGIYDDVEPPVKAKGLSGRKSPNPLSK